jgi:hypothetical protein
LLLFAGPLAAQSSTDAAAENLSRFDEALGGFASFVGGTGLSYQEWRSRFGWQVTAGGYYLPSEQGWYAVGVEGMYRIHAAALSDWFDSALYTVAGLGHYADIDGSGFRGSLTAGVGLGVESIFFEHFSVPIELLYTGEFVLNTLDLGSIGLQPAAGFRFRY